MLREDRALSILRRHLGETYADSSRGRVRLGIGDDAAIVNLAAPQVLTNDACLEGTHFLKGWLSAEDLAHKCLHPALSDLPAMGARPRAVLCHLTLSPSVDARFLNRFAKEQASIMKSVGAALVGGNVSFADKLGVVTTAVGELVGPALLQSGAMVGDRVWLIGELGKARAGWRLLERGVLRSRNRHLAACLAAFRRPLALSRWTGRLVRSAHCCLDVSDGLQSDATHLARRSGVRIVLSRSHLERIIPDCVLHAAAFVEESPLELVLRGGEDYALLATGPSQRRPPGVREIGWVEAGAGLTVSD